MKSLACQIKEEVDQLIASGKYQVVKGYYRLSKEKVIEKNKIYGFQRDLLPCGCAIGIVSAVCDGGKDTDMGRKGAIGIIRGRWPEITEADAAQLEMAFEGWNEIEGWRAGVGFDGDHAYKADPNNEFYKLGEHIAKFAK